MGVAFVGRLGKKMAGGPWKAAERIRGRWRIGGIEPYKVCEEDEELTGSRNLLESGRGKEKEKSIRNFS